MIIFLNCSLALLALINPLSKIFVISTLSRKSSREELRKVCIKASEIALGILILFTLIGNFLLRHVFQVNIYSFQIVGGLILLYRGFLALDKGLFYELDAHQKLEDSSVVPLASPMIAGPATITACVSFPAQYGMSVTLFAILIVVSINLIIMIFSMSITNVLKKHNILGALIRITGLLVATIGIQMMLDGITAYIKILAF